jgi:2-methylisocitrate lyase-like PEP mutase family enzyme
MQSQESKGSIFRALHDRAGAFIIPNPRNVGAARLLQLGFEAIATTSAGYAFSVGKQDNAVGRDMIMTHVAAIVSAIDLSVSADLENGFGDDPKTVAETLQLAIAAEIAGGSIEDFTNHQDDPIYEYELAADRVRAAAEVARSFPFPFTLTARSENYLHGRPDLNDTIRRLQVYQEAGADVLYAPGLTSKDNIAAVVHSVDRPVNVLMGLKGVQLSLATHSEIGVKRVSVGSTLARTAFGASLRAAREMCERGTFRFAEEAVSPQEISAYWSARESEK